MCSWRPWRERRPPGRAQPPEPADTLRITWEEFEATRREHPRLAGAHAARQAAAEELRLARTLPNPTGEAVRWQVDPRDGGPTTRELEGSVGLPLDWLWQRPALVRAARGAEALTAAEARQVEREVRLEAGTAFWTLVRDQALAASLDGLSLQAQELRRVVEARVQVGEVRPVEAARAQVEALQAEVEAAAARRSLAISRDHLRRWLLVEETRMPLAVADGDDPGAAPSLELRGGLERADDRLARSVGLALEVPLFHGNRGAVRLARARLAETEAGVEAVRFRLATDRDAAWAAQASSREAALAYRDHIVPRAEEALRALEVAWRVGEAQWTDVIDARRTLAATRRQAIEAGFQARLDALILDSLLEETQP